MTTEAQRILALARMVQDAEDAYDAAERDLTAAYADLDAAQKREAALAADLIHAHRIIDEQQQQIEVHQHAAVLAMEAHRRQAAEIDRWRARVMGGVWVWELEGCAN